MNTTVTQYEEVRRNLAFEKAIGQELDGVVRAAAKTVQLLAPARASEMRENQIRNVVSVAVETPSVEVITNFIRYQMGRSSQGKTWLYNNFGQAVISDIEGPVGEAAVRVADEVTAKVGGVDRKTICKDAHLKLARFYLGYLNRCFYYGDKTGRWDDLYREKGVCDDVRQV